MNRESFVEELLFLSPEELASDLPEALRLALEAHPEWQEEVHRLRMFDAALPEMAQDATSPRFYEDQYSRIMSGVEAQAQASQVPVLSTWKAPEGGLILLSVALVGYVFLGLEGSLLGSSYTIPSAFPSLTDPSSVFALLYLGIFGLGIQSMRLDSQWSAAPETAGG